MEKTREKEVDILLANHPLGATLSWFPSVRGRILFAVVPSKRARDPPKIDILGRIEPHRRELDLYFKVLERVKQRAYKADPEVRNETVARLSFDPQRFDAALHLADRPPIPRRGQTPLTREDFERLLDQEALFLSKSAIRKSREELNSAVAKKKKTKKQREEEQKAWEAEQLAREEVDRFQKSEWAKYLVGEGREEKKTNEESRNRVNKTLLERYGVRISEEAEKMLHGRFEPIEDPRGKALLQRAILRRFLLAREMNPRVAAVVGSPFIRLR